MRDQAHPVDPRSFEGAVAVRRWFLRQSSDRQSSDDFLPAVSLLVRAQQRLIEILVQDAAHFEMPR